MQTEMHFRHLEVPKQAKALNNKIRGELREL